jgi:hypothetical protein
MCSLRMNSLCIECVLFSDFGQFVPRPIWQLGSPLENKRRQKAPAHAYDLAVFNNLQTRVDDQPMPWVGASQSPV